MMIPYEGHGADKSQASPANLYDMIRPLAAILDHPQVLQLSQSSIKHHPTYTVSIVT